jgi:hypothetical protein
MIFGCDEIGRERERENAINSEGALAGSKDLIFFPYINTYTLDGKSSKGDLIIIIFFLSLSLLFSRIVFFSFSFFLSFARAVSLYITILRLMIENCGDSKVFVIKFTIF